MRAWVRVCVYVHLRVCVCVSLCAFACPQVEKTRHYLLLREKLEATLQAGQEALYKTSDASQLSPALSPVMSPTVAGPPAPQSPAPFSLAPLSPVPLSPNQRQRELAAKVTALLWSSRVL